MECLKDIFGKFLDEQKEKLTKNTYNKYRDIINLFEDYLDGYAYQNLESKEYELFENKFNKESKQYCEIFSVEQITIAELKEFLSYFMIRKVMGSKELMKYAGTVLRKFVKWLNENSYIDNDKFDKLYHTINEIKDDLPKVEELSELLYDIGKRNSINKFDKYEEDNFIISKIEDNKLWLESFMEENKEVGPVKVSKEISSLAQVGWNVYLVLGQRGGSWFIIKSGNVYPD